MGHDPELEFLQDRELLDVANLLASRRLPEPPLDPAFRSSLRRDLRRRQWEMLETSLPWWRRPFAGPGLAWSGAALGAVMIAAAVLFATHGGSPSGVAVVSSPLDHMRDVAVLQPMELRFAQPMDHQSVETALQIQPATKVNYVWQGNTLIVQPAAGQLAPNTQYRMTLAPTATTSTGTPLAKPATIVFVTAAAPAPTPTASPTPQPTGIALGTPVQVAPAASAVAPAWAGSTLYFAAPDDSLQSAPAAGGTPTSLNVPAVASIALGSDGNSPKLAVMSADAVTTLGQDGSSLERHLVSGGLAIAWYRPGEAVVALPAGVYDAKGGTVDLTHALVQFTAPAQQVAFSPDGSRLLYDDATGKVHLVDIQAGKDTAWQSSTSGLPVWSQDGTQTAFLTLQGVETAAPDGTGASPLATFDQLGVHSGDGVTLAWSGTAVLATTPAGLAGVDTVLKAPVQLATGSGYAVPAASPDHGSLAYVQGGRLWVVPLQRPGQDVQLLVKAKAVLQSFMDARKAGDSTTAGKYLDSAGQQAYGKSLIVNGQPHLARWFSVFTQAHPDGSVLAVVRLVLADDKEVEVSQLDESITLVSAADGTVAVDGVTATPLRKVDSGPEVLGVQIAGGKLQVQFDSDLDPSTVSSAAVTAPDGTATGISPVYANRTITFDLSAEPADMQLELVIPDGLKDVGGHPAAQPISISLVVPSNSS